MPIYLDGKINVRTFDVVTYNLTKTNKIKHHGKMDYRPGALRSAI